MAPVESSLPIKPQNNTETDDSENSNISASNSTEDWQLTRTSIKERFSYLLNNEVYSDVCFIVGSKPDVQRIPAHKIFLSAASPVFSAMLSETWASQVEIELPDVEPVAFLTLLRYLYTDEVQITIDTIMPVFYVAKKYMVPWLENQCVQFIFQVLCPQNSFFILSQTQIFSDKQLLENCLKAIDRDTLSAVSEDYFCDIDVELLSMVLKRDSLKISEIQLFEAVCRWSEAECKRKDLAVNPENQRLVLEEVIPLIRFPLMSAEEFSMRVANSGILLDKEVISLFQYLVQSIKPDIVFSSTPRKIGGDKKSKKVPFQGFSNSSFSGFSVNKI